MEDIGRKIRELRQQKGMTLEELGNRVGVGKRRRLLKRLS